MSKIQLVGSGFKNRQIVSYWKKGKDRAPELWNPGSKRDWNNGRYHLEMKAR